MTLDTAEIDPLIGTVINGYRLVQAIGRGGMGAVYRAVQPTIDAEVAIKVLAAELVGEPESVERFIAEAKVANLVRHEGLVKVIGLGVLPDGRPYQMMEHLTGVPLSSALHTRMPLGTLAMRLAEALRAIGAMHARNIVHRDLKPSNLFVTTAGYIKVLDFGIAKLADATGLTRTGHTIGTPEYMSPEQAEASALDGRSDIYSMGIVLYECVTGSRPFEGRVVEAMAKREPPPHVEPAALDAIIQTAMQAAPRDRYQDADKMARALELAAEGLPEGPLLGDVELRPPALVLTPATDLPVAEAPATVVAKPPSAPTPRKLGRYLIEHIVGAGGDGQVLLGIDPDVERKVALKLVTAHGAQRRERVLAEARAMAKVNHPNVVTLFELGEDDGQLFLAMEYLEAIDLGRWLRQDTRTTNEIIARFTEAGRGLAAAHAAGVVHRDFKPANVLVTSDGRAKVGDFGIARTGGVTNVARGTVGYMPPEQLEGGAIDPRADQFAFAAALWHALHGELPFGSEESQAVALALAVHRGELKQPKNRDVPAHVNDALRRALAARPAARFPSMHALLAKLEPRRAKRWPLVLAIAAAVLALTGGGIYLELRPHAPPPLTLEQIAALPTGNEQLRALAKLPVGARTTEAARSLANDAVLDGYARSVQLPDPPTSGTFTISAAGKYVAVAIKSSPWIYDVAANTSRSLPPAPADISALYVDDTAQLVRAAVPGGVVQIPLAGGTWTKAMSCDARAPDKLVHDRALRITVCDQTNGYFVYAADNTPPWVADIPGKPTVSTNGTRIYGLAFDDSVVITLDVANRIEHKHELPPGAQLVYGENLLAIVVGNGVTMWDPVTDRTASFTDPTWQPITGAAILDDGTHARVVLTTSAQATYVLTLDRHADPMILARISMVPKPPQRAFAAGNRLVATYADHVTVDSWSSSWVLPGAPGLVLADASGEHLALLDDRTLRVWDVSLRQPVDIPADEMAKSVIGEPWFVTRTGSELRWYSTASVSKTLATLPVSADARLVASAVSNTIFYKDASGTWSWQPDGKPQRISSRTDFSAVFEVDHHLVGHTRYKLVRLDDDTPLCNDLEVVTAAWQGLAVVDARPPKLCKISDGSLYELPGAPMAFGGAVFEFTRDASLLALHTGAGPPLIYDTTTHELVSIPGLEGMAGAREIDGTRDALYVRRDDGTFALVNGRTLTLHAESITSTALSGHLLYMTIDNDIVEIDITNGARHVVARTTIEPAIMGRLFSIGPSIISFDGIRKTATIWSIATPSSDVTERWLALAGAQ